MLTGMAGLAAAGGEDLVVALLLSLLWTHVGGGCIFPHRLQGSWYSKDAGHVLIGLTNMTGKGTCVEQWKDYYVIENGEANCQQCLWIHERHRNVLQYRESYCMPKDTLNSTCKQIRQDAMLHTLVKEPSSPSRCPFQDAYHFSYNNNTGGFCRYPGSYVKSCASSARFRFHFKECSDAAYTYDRELDFECLATWIDSQDMYMFGRFNGPGMMEKTSQYRCAMYQVLGTVVYLAMSGDATCRGLRSPRDGPLVMEFTKDVFGWPQPACSFPPFMTTYTWRDLPGHHLYATNTEGTVITVTRQERGVPAEVTSALRCLKVAEGNTTSNRFVGISFTSDGCIPRYQCIMFLKRRAGVSEIHLGSYLEYDSDPCLKTHFNNAIKRLLIPAPSTATSCPFPGLYRLEPDDPSCTGYIQSGCNGSDSLEVVSKCSSQPKVHLECIRVWGGLKKQFVVASRAGDLSGVANCFLFKKKGNSLFFAVDRTCNIGTTDIFNIAIKYDLNPIPEKCIAHVRKPLDPPQVESRHTNERDTQREQEAKDEPKEDPFIHIDSKDPPQSQIANSVPRTLASWLTLTCDIGLLLVTVLFCHR